MYIKYSVKAKVKKRLPSISFVYTQFNLTYPAKVPHRSNRWYYAKSSR